MTGAADVVEAEIRSVLENVLNVDELPWVQGGPLWPMMMLACMCIFMLRGISACSLLREQVQVYEEEKLIIVTLLKRKTCQEGDRNVACACVCCDARVESACGNARFQLTVWGVHGDREGNCATAGV